MRFIHFIFYFMFLLNPLASAMENLDLFKVAQEGNAKQIKELIDSGIDLSKKDANGRNALMHSVIFGNKETVLELLKEFKELENIAKSKGFLLVSSSPLTRSSYHADADFKKLQEARHNQVECHQHQ